MERRPFLLARMRRLMAIVAKRLPRSPGATNCFRSTRLVVAVILLAECSTNLVRAQNLTGQLNVHDPSSVAELDGRYYLFYTGNRVRSKFSDDLLRWSEGPRVFNSAPSWVASSVPNNSSANFWAPDVAYFNDLYHLYYSVSTFGSQESAIGLATNPTLDPSDPAYQWTDRGPVIESNVGDPYNTIDPSIIQTSGDEIWMTFGSFWNGIYTRRIDPNTGLLMTGSRGVPVGPYQLASNGATEASYMYERDGLFYLFVNWGTCCQGISSTYNIRVGRSNNISGPFLDQDGVNMANGGGTLFLGTEGRFIGPGHISIFSAHGTDWFGYHYYDGDNNGVSKYNLRALRWSADGWPVAGPPFPIPEPSGLTVTLTAVGLIVAAGGRIRRLTNGVAQARIRRPAGIFLTML
jgi:arabinan endo-1,5-alpha-L-arabinosidase